jgi:hypothetical protein
MTVREYTSAVEAGEMIDQILAEASDPMSPTVTPFTLLGADDGAEATADQRQTEAPDLWQLFRQT